MATRETTITSATAQVERKPARPHVKAVNVFRCMIVSADAQRRAMFAQAADDGGWHAFVCESATGALAHLDRSLVQLAVIDMQKSLDTRPATDALRQVVEQIASRRDALLIVCGNEDAIDEELWVRQLGAWLYLPGVVESNDFALLCGEARHIAERLSKVHRSATTGSAAAPR